MVLPDSPKGIQTLDNVNSGHCKASAATASRTSAEKKASDLIHVNREKQTNTHTHTHTESFNLQSILSAQLFLWSKTFLALICFVSTITLILSCFYIMASSNLLLFKLFLHFIVPGQKQNNKIMISNFKNIIIILMFNLFPLCEHHSLAHFRFKKWL